MAPCCMQETQICGFSFLERSNLENDMRYLGGTLKIEYIGLFLRLVLMLLD